MKLLLGILAAAVIVLAVVLVKTRQAANERAIEASNEVAAAHVETTSVKEQMREKAAEFEQKVSSLATEKAQAEEQVQALTNQLTVVQLKLQQEQEKVSELEQETQRQAAEIQVATNRLAATEEKLSAVEESHKTALGHLAAMRQEYVMQAQEKAAMEAKLHNLGALKQQIHTVKLEMHNQKVAEWKRLDKTQAALGNGGFLMKSGHWVVAPTPGKFPLTQEIHAPND
jgi:chromosome segregation ATPase